MNKDNSNGSIAKIIKGVRKFQTETYPEKQALFKSLAREQNPKILFITCSDARIDPSLIMQTQPGDIFVVQNAGNIIPPHGVMYGGTSASIEFAVTILGIEHIIVCGHSDCGAMRALLDEKILEDSPQIQKWLSYAETSRAIVDAEIGDRNVHDAERIYRCTQKNVQVQLNHLKTIPVVAAGLATGKITMHGWVYEIATGDIKVFDDVTQDFSDFNKAYAA